jgi:hypothetical protein
VNQDYSGEKRMDDEKTTHLDVFSAQIQADIEAMQREHEREAVIEEIVTAVDNLIQHVEALERDLKWLLAIPRVYRVLRKRIARLFSYRRVVRTGKVLGAIGSAVGLVGGVQKLVGWRQVFNWLAKIFTGQ